VIFVVYSDTVEKYSSMRKIFTVELLLKVNY